MQIPINGDSRTKQRSPTWVGLVCPQPTILIVGQNRDELIFPEDDIGGAGAPPRAWELTCSPRFQLLGRIGMN